LSIGDEQESWNSGTALPSEAEAGAILRDVREAAGLSLRAAGKFLGTHHNVVYGWEHDTSKAQIRYLVGLARTSEAARLVLLRAMGGSLREMVGPEIADAELRSWLEDARYAWENRGNDTFRLLIEGLRSCIRMVGGLRRPGNGNQSA
jgi:transcriptional regulator with XRE-family HTH domain